MKVTFGILAHVDAGKTTFSEQVLFRSGLIRSLGRVDSGNSFMDCHEVERERGITVFSEQAAYRRGEDTYYLIDTPGHADFSSEMERAAEQTGSRDIRRLSGTCSESIGFRYFFLSISWIGIPPTMRQF